jgi:hypothetical protein
MRKGLRIALATAAVAAGLAFAGASPARAQVQFGGSFPLPHGRISIGFGDPYFPVGSYAPAYCNVYSHPRYGYGFTYRSRFIPVRRYRSRWVIVERPVVVRRVYTDDEYFGAEDYDDGYVDDGYIRRGGYSHRDDWRYSRDYRYDDSVYRTRASDPYCTH